MSSFDELVKLYETREGTQKLLFGLIEKALSQSDIYTEAKTGTKELVVKMPEVQIDASWVSNEAEALNPNSYDKFKKIISAMRLPNNIRKLPEFIKAMQGLLVLPVNVEKHSEAISRIQVLRVLFNLVKTSASSNAGFTFERFLAMVFNGHVQPPRDPGIVDIKFEDASISAKLLTKMRPNIKGSISELLESLSRVNVVTYLVCLKPDMKSDMVLDFYTFDVTRENAGSLPGVNPKDFEQGKGRFEGRNIERFKNFNLKNIGSINLKDTVKVSQKIMEALNTKFEGLLLELQSLIKQVDELVYVATDPEKTREKAGAAKGEAEDTRAAAEKIEKSA